jgi:hypothetical protein
MGFGGFSWKRATSYSVSGRLAGTAWPFVAVMRSSNDADPVRFAVSDVERAASCEDAVRS